MRDSTRKGIAWGFAFGLIFALLVIHYDRTHGLPFSFPFEAFIASVALCALLGRVFGGDSR